MIEAALDGEATARETVPEILVMALGNTLLTDDGAGQAVLEGLESQRSRWGSRVELVDGGTQGIMLLGRLENRRAIVFLDAVQRGSPPGTVHVLQDEALLQAANPRSTTAHESNAGDLLRAATLLQKLPQRVALVGVEPDRVETGYGLQAGTRAAVDQAVVAATEIVDTLISQ